MRNTRRGRCMIKSEYLSDTDVKLFMRWLIPLCDKQGIFTHQYIDRRSGEIWRCDSIYDAFFKYQWSFTYTDENNQVHSGKSFAENTTALERLQNQLRCAFLDKDLDRLCSITCMVFEWGGVRSNKSWAIENRNNLFHTYQQGMSLLKPSIANDIGAFPRRFNSGMTKIYSLLLNDFMIYDSRVGATLGYLVVRYCQQRQLKKVPHLLDFPWAEAKDSNPKNAKNRNPSCSNYKLKQITNSQEHARWNLRASWLLNEVAKSSQLFSKERDPLRSLEAALFMIGYDLGGNDEPIETLYVPPTVNQPIDYPLKTHGKGHYFRVELNKDNNQLVFSYPIKNNGKQRTVDQFSFSEIEQVVVYLEQNFQGRPFPLANDVALLAKYAARSGLGMALMSVTGNVTKAQAASYLGPYMEDVGAFTLVSARPAQWRLIAHPKDIKGLICAYHA